MKLVSISAVRLVIIVMVAYVIVLVQSDSTFIFLAPVSSTNVNDFLATGCLVGRCLLEQNYYILGGLNKVLPLPQIFILSGSLSVVGYPSLTGSYSKDYLIYSGFHSYLYDSYFLYLQATVGVVTTGRYSTRLLYLVFIRTKVSVTLPILVFGEGTGILAVNPLPLMVSTGVLGFVSSEPFTGIGSDYLFDALQFSGGTSALATLYPLIQMPFRLGQWHHSYQ